MDLATVPKEGGFAHQNRPPWIKARLSNSQQFTVTSTLIQEEKLHTICEEALCPNRAECFSHGVATFLLLGDTCTRNCRYCHVKVGRPGAVDLTEPRRVAKAVERLGLSYVVLTSVNRDDLADGGATVFALTVQAIKQLTPKCTVELLIPDFKENTGALSAVTQSAAEVIGHNLETVRSLFPVVRAQGNYDRSLRVLIQLKALRPEGSTKSGLMLGLGEREEEVHQALKDLRAADCDFLTLGQYLQPTTEYHPVQKYYSPEEFVSWKQRAEHLGFIHVEAGPLVRSSYRADKLRSYLSEERVEERVEEQESRKES